MARSQFLRCYSLDKLHSQWQGCPTKLERPFLFDSRYVKQPQIPMASKGALVLVNLDKCYDMIRILEVGEQQLVVMVVDVISPSVLLTTIRSTRTRELTFLVRLSSSLSRCELVLQARTHPTALSRCGGSVARRSIRPFPTLSFSSALLIRATSRRRFEWRLSWAEHTLD